MADTWYRRLTRGKRPISLYSRQAGSWGTCALHEHDPNEEIPRGMWSAPTDAVLRNLGNEEFRGAVAVNDRPRALSIYRQIRTRVRELLRA